MAGFFRRASESTKAAFGRLRAAFHPSKPWVARTRELGRSRRVRKIGVIVVSVVLFLGLATYIAVPPILRHVLTGSVAGSIHRQVSVGKIRFNLYRLKLDLDQLHVGERDDPQKPFVDLGHLTVKVSWTSMFRFAPVVGEVVIEKPAIHVVRLSQQKFNFSDLLESAPAPAKPKPAAPSSPMRFAVSNIQLRDGEMTIDDQLLGKQHKVEKIQINVPFIANLPADVDVFVQPLVQMVIDGSPLRIAGVAKPFQATRDSVVDLKLHRLDLPLYVSYAPMKLPVKIPSGTLSTDLYLHFVQAESQPLIRLNGTVALDQLDVRDTADAPLVALKHAEVKLTDVEPLGAVFYLRSIWIDGLIANVRLNADGTNNLSSLASSGGSAPAASPPAQVAAASTPIAAPTPAGNVTQQAVPVAGPSTAKPPMDFQLESFVLTKSGVNIQDNSGATPATDALDALEVGVKNLRTLGKSPATFYVNTNVHSGGALAVQGALDLSQSQVTSDVSIDKIDLPALQPFAQKFLAATVASGKFSAKANVQTHFASDKFNVHAEPASVAIENFEVDAPHEKEKPVQWKNFSVAVGQFDLASRQATVTEVKSRRDASVCASRARRQIESRIADARQRTSATRRARGDAPAEANPARTQASRAQTSTARRTDDAGVAEFSIPGRFRFAGSDRRHLRRRKRAETGDGRGRAAESASQGRDQRLRQAFWGRYRRHAESQGHFQSHRHGRDCAAQGRPARRDEAPRPDLRESVREQQAERDDHEREPDDGRRGRTRAGAQGFSGQLQGRRVARQRADARQADQRSVLPDGRAQREPDRLRARQRSAESARGTDRAERFLFADHSQQQRQAESQGHHGESAGSADLADARGGRAGLEGRGAGRADLDSDAGRRAERSRRDRSRSQSGSSASPAQPYQGQPMNADVELSKITFKGGKVDYTDNFIKPNYTANLTDMEGSVGAFGTKSTTPAPVTLDGKINGSSPINIDGSINPLAPTAFVDIKAKADAIELTGVSPYTVKYTGYPIVKGTLTVDVHYLLDAGKLTADNHIFIDQLTFGDHVESPDATNLPIRLAVSLLKNSKGQIDVRIPISGSLSDPQFSIGAIVLGAFMNLIVKAATAPFSLIASAFGSVTGGGAPQDLAYIEFAPGYSTLTPESQQKLDTVAKALADRTALKLNIEGRVDPKFDNDGYQEASLDHSIQVLRHKPTGTARTRMENRRYRRRTTTSTWRRCTAPGISRSRATRSGWRRRCRRTR